MKKLLTILTISTLASWQISTLILSLVYCLLLTANAQGSGNSLEFIENHGQIVDMEGNLRPDILYVGDGGGAKIYLQQGMVSYVMSEVEGLEEIEELEEKIEHEKNEIEKKKKQEKLTALKANVKLKGHRVDMEFVNANVDASVKVEDPTGGYFNYYLAHCPEGITGVKAHRKVVYENMYPNIDIIFYGGKAKGMEYDFVVKPGGNIRDIKLRYKGDNGIGLDEGKLKIQTTIGDILEEIPEVYQIIEGEKVDIEAAYVLKGNEVSIEVRNYDKTKSLIIDPWITYYGGIFNDIGEGIATDGSGNVVITGSTASINFPVTVGAFQTSFAGGGGAWSGDAIVVKFDAAGNRLWATLYGGSGSDACHGIAIDGSDNVMITGNTLSTDFPVTIGAFQTSHAGGMDAFVVKFDSSGNQLWATFYGGNGWEYSKGIATDGNDNVLIAGNTESTNFPVTGSAFQTSFAGVRDAFVVKLDAAGDTLWATYYGGGDDDEYCNGISIDNNENVVITGFTGSNDFPVTPGAFQTNLVGGYDAFIVKFNPSGNQLWATYYGGTGGDYCYSNGAVDGGNNIIITGITRSTKPSLPITTSSQIGSPKLIACSIQLHYK